MKPSLDLSGTPWTCPLLAGALLLASAGAPCRALDVEPGDVEARIQQVGVLVSLAASADEPEPYAGDLLAIAHDAVEATAPCPHAATFDGRLDPTRVSPEFVGWAEASGLDPEGELRWVREGLPKLFAAMVTLDTPSSIEILERALATGHCVLTPIAAANLAFVGDPRHIARIEEAAEGQPADIRKVLALALVRYGTPEAEAAVVRLLGNGGLEALAESD